MLKPRINRIAISLLLVLWSATAFSAGESGTGKPHADGSPIVSKINIEIEGGRGDEARLKSMAREMILLAEGKPFSEEMLQKSLAVLKASRMFETIRVPDPDWRGPDIALTFHLTPFLRIRALRVEGAFPIFEREVQNAMTLRSGGRYVADRIPAHEAAVVELFKKQGYIAPAVKITAEPDAKADLVNVTVKIDKGPYLKIERFEIEGNRSFSDFRLKLRTDTWKKSHLFGGIRRFVRKDLDEDVKNLVKFYRAKGYADATVTAHVEEDPGEASVNIRLEVEEGLRYDVTFEGNNAFWAWWTLRRDLALEGGNKNGAGLKKSLRNIRKRYREDGYLESRVTAVEPEGGDRPKGTREIRIVIDEGPQSIVENIRIEGNEAFDDEKIEKQMLTRTPGIFSEGGYDPRRLKSDIGAIKSLYFKDGYRKTAVERQMKWLSEASGETAETEGQLETQGKAAADQEAGNGPGGKRYGDLTLTIDEGVQTRVASLSITGTSAVPVETVLEAVALKAGEPFRESLLKSDEETITSIIAEKGYPYVQVEGSAVIGADGAGADVVYAVTEGRYVALGQVYFTGNFRTAEQILKNELEVRPGGPFSVKKILESQRNIQNMEAIDSVRFRVPGLQAEAEAEAVSLFMEVEEKRPYWLEISLGYDTERHLFAAARGGDRNLFGRNNDLRGSIEISQIGYRVDTSFTEPRFWRSRISSTSTLFAEKREEFNQNFGTRSFGASQIFNRRLLDDDLTLGLSFLLERREQYMLDGQPVPEGDEDLYVPRTVFVTTPSVIYNTTDSFTRPTKGINASLFVDLSTGLQESLDNFLKYRFETRYYYTPAERLTFALRGRYGYIYPYGSDTVVPDDQLFYLGGTTTVRGYDENLLRFNTEGDAVGGLEAILGNVEARYYLGMNIEALVFYDVGSVRKAEGQGGSDDFRSSIGLGLQYITPIGAVGLAYGWKIDPMAGEDAGRLHFSIGYTF